ncbi:cupin domain-containing protein [Pseudomonas sp. GD03817]|jgi:mannose-6-phosphate isomerase-like protein (cupin superfamily)|uniref:cupin domain-containing protein n=1 Tax=Pseudomonas TaxID=286 RepID=UPI00156E15B4|nr:MULTISPECIES: cupin domain-containing protein [Pseudomonas]MCE0992425.1 cupin domain-containing protein [Pseudomonas alloputida]MDH1402489.1 cupin domain-containing protein [Pseudomonas sp. GD03730]MDH1775548.1 cupin domain-containing protein [Pseudomonas sp. GD03817]WNI06913.1 cupin domain-containing protein [Pseudomonas putida]
MKVRRVVAGTQNGKAVFLADGFAPQTHEYKNIPGFATSLIWQTVASPSLPEAFDDPVQASSSLLPQPGETKCLAVSFPPDSIFQSSDFNPEEAHAEQQRHLLGLYECFDLERPGMHASPTVDYGIVVKGPLILELDDGQIRELASGDIVVQQGNIHAWRNPGTEPALVTFVLIGAHVLR